MGLGHEMKYSVVIPTKDQLTTTGNVPVKVNGCRSSRLK